MATAITWPSALLGETTARQSKKEVKTRYILLIVRRMDEMAHEERIEALKVRHQTLEAMIHKEMTRPHPDTREISSLKKEKLRIKDEISEFVRH